MYKPKKFETTLDPKEALDEFNKATEELAKHCQLIAALQAMNCTLLDRIRVLEEKR
jgi:hypothetical protein